MAEQKVSKLPIRAIKDDYEKYKETVEIDFMENEETYRVTLYPFFENTRIKNVLSTLKDDLVEIDKKGVNLPDELLPTFIIYHTLAEFSNFPVNKSKDIRKRIAYFMQVINTKYFKECTDSMLQDEVDKVFESVMEIMAESERVERQLVKLADDIGNLDLKNPELREIVQSNKKRIPEA